MKKAVRFTNKTKNRFIEEWISSGQTQKIYCASKNLSFKSFSNWVYLYRKERNIPSKVRSRDLAPHFVALELTKELPIQVNRAQEDLPTGISIVPRVLISAVEITYPKGICLKIGSELDMEQLRTLLNLI
jgi:hypothetical protein